MRMSGGEGGGVGRLCGQGRGEGSKMAENLRTSFMDGLIFECLITGINRENFYCEELIDP